MREDIKERIDLIKCGKVPEGYKKTSVGIVPCSWSVMKVGACICESKELSNDIEEYDVYSSTRSGLMPQTEYFDKQESVETNLGYKIVKNGYITYRHMSDDDVFHFNINKLNKTILVSNEYPVFTTNTNINNEILLASLNYGARFRYFCKGQKMGGTRTRLYLNKLSQYCLAVPNKYEQEIITNILTGVDKNIECLERIIEKKRIQKNYLKQSLLLGKKRISSYEKEWKRVCLSKVLKERKEYALKNDGFEHVTLAKDGIIPKSEKYDREHLVKNVEKKYKVTRRGDICYNPANLKFGVICKNEYGDAIFSPIYVTFEVNEEYDVEFIAQYVTTSYFINAVRKYEEGTVYERMAVKAEDLLKFEANIPDIEEQREIAKILSLADKEITLLKNKLAMVEQEKRSLIALLLAGTVRVEKN